MDFLDELPEKFCEKLKERYLKKLLILFTAIPEKKKSPKNFRRNSKKELMEELPKKDNRGISEGTFDTIWWISHEKSCKSIQEKLPEALPKESPEEFHDNFSKNLLEEYVESFLRIHQRTSIVSSFWKISKNVP